MGPERVDEAFRDRLKQEFAPISEATLRAALLASGLPLDPLVEGVRQDSPVHLERTLLALAAHYETADAAGRGRIRALVITAKTHARYALLRLREETRRQEKEEALLWLRTWLENPPVFEAWLAIRLRATTAIRQTPPESPSHPVSR